MYVNKSLEVAEAIINDDGFVVGARVLDRSITFDKLPLIEVVLGVVMVLICFVISMSNTMHYLQLVLLKLVLVVTLIAMTLEFPLLLIKVSSSKQRLMSLNRLRMVLTILNF